MFFLFICFFLSVGFYLFGWLLSMLMVKQAEKLNTFECGYVNLFESRVSFSVFFFFFSLLFLVFDVEVSLLLPSPLFLSNMLHTVFSMIIFLIILVYIFFFEWYKNILNWAY